MKTTKKTVNKTIPVKDVPVTKLLSFIRTNPNLGSREIHKKLGGNFTFTAVRTALADLLRTGKVTWNVRTGYALPAKKIGRKAA